MAVKPESLIVLEESLTRRLEARWARQAKARTNAIVKAVRKNDMEEVRRQVEKIDLSKTLKNNEKYLEFISMSALLLGASKIRPARKSKVFEEGKEIDIFESANRQFSIVLEEANLTLRKIVLRAVEQITSNQVARKAEAPAVAGVLQPDFAKRIDAAVGASGRGMIQLASGLHASRMSSYGFCVEADTVGIKSYRVSEQLDRRTCPVCEFMHGKTFEVETAFQRLDMILRVTDTDQLKQLAPWPSQTKEGLKSLYDMDKDALVEAGWDTPPYHPGCRGILVTMETAIPSSPPIRDVTPSQPDALKPVPAVEPRPAPSSDLPDVDGTVDNLVSRASMQKISNNQYLDDEDFIQSVFGKSSLEMSAKVQSIVDDSDVYMAIKAPLLRNSIVKKSDSFKNSLETGKGTFKTIGEARAAKERVMFGIEADLTDFDKWPKYGFLGSKTNLDTKHIDKFGYGDVYVKFKRSNVRSRTTTTMGDSYNNNGISVDGTISSLAPAQRLDNVDHRLLYSYAGRNAEKVREAAKKPGTSWNRITTAEKIEDLAAGAEYPEVQIYGKLDLSDVAEIHVGSKKEAKALSDALKAKKVDVDLVPLNSDSRLSNLFAEDKLLISLGPDDIDRFGSAYIDKIFETHQRRFKGFFKHDPAFKRKVFDGELMPDEIRDIVFSPPDELLPDEKKREFLRWTASELAKKEKGTLPKVWWEDFRPSLVNWTDDIFNESLLKGPVI